MDSRAPRGAKRGSSVRRILIIVALMAVLIPVAASKFPRETPMLSVPDSGGSYTEAVIGNPTYLNPILLQFNQVDRDISSLIFSGLTRFDENGMIVPDLAERWDVSDGGKTYLFQLRKDVRWHDRTPFTADDVVFTVKEMQRADFQGSPDVADLWRNVQVEQVSDYSVRFTLKDPYAPFLEFASVGILPHHLYADTVGKAMTDSQYNLRPIGTGPFRWNRTATDSITLEAHPDYHGPVPHLAQLRFRFFPDYAGALAALEKGEVDAFANIDPQDVARLKSNEKLAVYSAPDFLRYTVLFMNNTSPIFRDKSIRQAVAYAINRDRLIQTVLDGQGAPGKGPISPGSWAFDAKAKSYEYDPKKAESLLDSAGWQDGNADGIREKDGQPLTFVILTNDNRRRVKVGELIADDLRKVGFKSEIQVLGWTDLLREYMATRTFQGVIAEQWLMTADPDIYTLWHSSQAGNGGFNFSGLVNEKMDKLLEDGRRTMDRSARTQIYGEFQQLWEDESPALILYYPQFNWGVSRAVKDVKLSAFIDSSSRFRHVSEWYTKTRSVTATPEKR
jgi:peptide/nickel transport system substrate-binding protein